jgi:glycosyltransferase involved in cell wall biosynthesis
MLKISIIIPCYTIKDNTLMKLCNRYWSKRILIGNVIVTTGSPDETEIISQKWAAKILGLTIYIKKWWFK